MSLYGPIVGGWLVSRAMVDHLKGTEDGSFLRDCLAEMERITGRDPESLPMPRSWERASEVRKWPESQLPAIVVVNTGFADAPRKEGDGAVAATYRLGVMPVVSANTQANTMDLADVYAMAVLLAIEQHPSLSGFARGATCRSFDKSPLPVDDEDRSLAAGYLLFDVEVPEILNTRGGTREPREDPYVDPGDWPEVQTHDVEVEKL